MACADSSSERFIAELLAEEEAAAKQKEKKQAKAAKKKVGWIGVLSGWLAGGFCCAAFASHAVDKPEMEPAKRPQLAGWAGRRYAPATQAQQSVETTTNPACALRSPYCRRRAAAGRPASSRPLYRPQPPRRGAAATTRALQRWAAALLFCHLIWCLLS